MLENILLLEKDLFVTLNGSNSEFLDHFMYLFSEKLVWIPLALFILYSLCKHRTWQQITAIIASIALAITFADQFASGFCKDYFLRLRPTHHPDFMDEVKTVLGYRGGLYGFISSHAANAFAFAMLLSKMVGGRFLSISIFTWASISAYSRIYLGVHFISDIIPGIIAGLIIGYAIALLYKKLPSSFQSKFTSRQSTIISLASVASMLLLLALTPLLIQLF